MTSNKMIFIPPVRCFDRVEADKEQAVKILEEAAEVFGAWQGWNALRGRLPEGAESQRDRIVEECCDVIQATCNLLHALGEVDMAVDMALCERRNRERGRIS